MEAYDLRNAGKWTEATATLVASGRLLKASANRLHTAAEASIEGAETAVKWLRRVKTAAEITELVAGRLDRRRRAGWRHAGARRPRARPRSTRSRRPR